MKKTIIHQVNETALKLLEKHPGGISWSELNRLIEKRHPDFHPKTINGCVWKLVEKFPDVVHKPEKGLFRLKRFG